MVVALSGLLDAWWWSAHIGAIADSGLKAASLVSVPPHSVARAGWIVSRCAGVAALVPFSSHFRQQGVTGVAYTSFVARAARTTRVMPCSRWWCLPSVWLSLETAMAHPVTYFATPQSNVVGVQAFFGVQLCIPELHDVRKAISQHRMPLLGL